MAARPHGAMMIQIIAHLLLHGLNIRFSELFVKGIWSEKLNRFNGLQSC